MQRFSFYFLLLVLSVTNPLIAKITYKANSQPSQEKTETQQKEKEEQEKKEKETKEEKEKKEKEEKEKAKKKDKEKIIFGGTSLSYSADTVPPGRLVVEEIFSISKSNGFYDDSGDFVKDRDIFQFQYYPYLKIGLIKNIDFNLITSVVETHHKDDDVLSAGDTLLLLGLQLMEEDEKSNRPDIKLLIGESLPTGKFDSLTPSLSGAEGIGSGSFETVFLLSLGKRFKINCNHAFRINPNFFLYFPTPVQTSDLSIYGGFEGIKGIAELRPKIFIDIPLEYNLTNHLILALDIFYTYKGRVNFFQKNNSADIVLPSSENLSLCPAIEYNPNERFSLEVGYWFSVSGRNTFAFNTWLITAAWLF